MGLRMLAAASLVAAALGVAALAVGSVAASLAWWAFSAGPWTHQPALVLDDPSPVGAVRVHGEHPGVDPRTAARDTVDDLVAAGGLDRAVVFVALPTGSGWVDPDQVAAMESWAGGDLATLSVRYSEAPSAAAYVLRPDLAEDSAWALLDEVTDRVGRLAPTERPALVVHGQSLGARAGAAAVTRLADHRVIDAALWQGAPGTAPPLPDDPCHRAEWNPDDPVAELSPSLIREPARALDVLTGLPGSQDLEPGHGHSYGPVLPPDGCVDVPTPVDADR